MPEFSLDHLTEKRPGVTVANLQVRRELSNQAIAKELLEGHSGDRIYALGQKRAMGATYLLARFIPGDGKSEFVLTWDRIPNDHVPKFIDDSSNRVGGLAGLEERLRKRLADDPITQGTMTAHYELVGWKSSWISVKRKAISNTSAVATPLGGSWGVENGRMLASFSLVKVAERIVLLASGKISDKGWPNITVLESALWQDLHPVVQHSERSK